MQEYLALWKNYFNFKGRTTVRGYWMAVLFNIIITTLFVALGSFVDALMILYSLYVLAACIPSLALQVRRLHDIGKSGWWIFISAVPLIGGILLLIWNCKASVDGNTQYGEQV